MTRHEVHPSAAAVIKHTQEINQVADPRTRCHEDENQNQ